MKFQFIANACGVFINDTGSKILCDPWINNGVFEGSWCHFHKLKTKLGDFSDIDCIYLSHLHPDHFDERFFDFPLDIPIVTLDHGPSFLIKILQQKGYRNVIGVKSGESIELNGFKLTLFSPFAKNNFHEAKIGNLIDSALVIEADGMVALNSNDNRPTPESCAYLKERYRRIDLAMINYNAAGPYPSCFDNLTKAEKKLESERIIKRNFEYLVSLLNVLKPRYFLPFAGAYVIGGSLAYKNEYLGTTTWDHCKEFLDNQDIETKVICLREKDIFDINTGKSDRPYIPIDDEEIKNYISSYLSQLKYHYEIDPYPDYEILKSDINLASKKMLERIKRFGLEPKMDIYLDLADELIQAYNSTAPIGSIKCRMDLRLLRRILDREAHWNNAEIGCHISFVREPNIYDPDLHTSLQFFHL